MLQREFRDGDVNLVHDTELTKQNAGLSFQEHFDREMRVLRGNDPQFEPKTPDILQIIENAYTTFTKGHSLTFAGQAAKSIANSLIAEGYAKKENAGSIAEVLLNKGTDSRARLHWDKQNGIYGQT